MVSVGDSSAIRSIVIEAAVVCKSGGVSGTERVQQR